jgi:DNA-binding beta-propeller fold protein YncE
MFVLTAPRILSLNMADGTRNADIELARTPISGGLAVDPNGEFVYVLATGAGGRGRWLSSIFARSGQQRFSVEVATSATAVALLTSPDGQRLYVLPIGEQTLTVFDARTGQRTYIVPLGDRIKDAVLSRNGQIIYVLTERSPIPLAITLTGGVRVAPALDKDPNNALVGATRLAVADYQQGHWLCLLLPSTRQVAIIDLDDRTIETVAVGREPAAMAHALSTDNLYVAHKGGNSLTVISLNDHTVIDEIDVRSRPSMLIPLQ